MKKLVITFFTTILVLSVFAAADTGLSLTLKPRCNAETQSEICSSSARIMMWGGNQAQVIGMGLKPNTEYVVVYHTLPKRINRQSYYKVECVGTPITTGNSGMMNTERVDFKYEKLTKDKIKQEFMIVEAKGVNCKRKNNMYFKPENALFSEETI